MYVDLSKNREYSIKLFFYFTNKMWRKSSFFFLKKAIENEGGRIKKSTCFLIKRWTSICGDFEREKVAINRTEMRAGYHYRVLRNNSRLL